MEKSNIRIIRVSNGVRFEVLPRNKHEQSLGVSPVYETEQACKDAAEQFCHLVRLQQLNCLKAPYVKISKEKDAWERTTYVFTYYDNNGTVVFMRDKPYYAKKNCINGITRVYNAIIES